MKWKPLVAVFAVLAVIVVVSNWSELAGAERGHDIAGMVTSGASIVGAEHWGADEPGVR